MGTEGMIHIFREAETVLRSWGKRGLKWHGVRVWALLSNLCRNSSCQLSGGVQGKNLFLS